jgi:hypothetical protein
VRNPPLVTDDGDLGVDAVDSHLVHACRRYAAAVVRERAMMQACTKTSSGRRAGDSGS